MHRVTLLVRWIALLGCAAIPVLGQRLSIDAAVRQGDKPYVVAHGEATISAKPDKVLIELSVVTRAATAASAAAANAKQADTLLAKLKQIATEGTQFKTARYVVRPEMRIPKASEPAVIANYLATNTLEVTVLDLDRITPIIDAATELGTSVQDLRFDLKDPRALRARALQEAAADARSNAEAIAAGLGLKTIRVLSADESAADGEEGFGAHKKMSVLPPSTATVRATPVEVGTIEVSARVTIRVEIGQ